MRSDWSGHSRRLLEDAKVLHGVSPRSAVNRLYYGVYARVTSATRKSPPYQHGWLNPAHNELPGLVDQIPGLSHMEKRYVKQVVKTLYQARVVADYHPWEPLDPAEVKDLFREAYGMLSILGDPS